MTLAEECTCPHARAEELRPQTATTTSIVLVIMTDQVATVHHELLSCTATPTIAASGRTIFVNCPLRLASALSAPVTGRESRKVKEGNLYKT